MDTPHRLAFRFSLGATHGACLVNDGRRGLFAESWAFRDGPAERRPLWSDAAESRFTQPVPTDDGRVVLVRTGAAEPEVAVLDPAADERRLATVDGRVLRAFPSPDPATLAWLVACRRDGRGGLYRVDAHDLRVEPVIELDGQLRGESWLSADGSRLAANQLAGGRARLVVVDLRAGTLTPAPHAEGLAVLLSSPSSGRLLLAAATPGPARLGLAHADDPTVEFAAGLNGVTGGVLPIAMDPTGRWLALRVTDGARSRLLIHDADADSVTAAALPPGVIRSAGWGATGLRLAFSTPTQPAAVLRYPDPLAAGPVAEISAPTAHRHDARLERFDGPGGPIEAVVYGPDRRHSRQVLVALHGGPQAAWELTFEPTFQRFADAGITVVAPNQRGSTNYGAAHRDALDGAWGGPDLADIRYLRTVLARGRRPPMLFGVSYGAFLALLAAAADPAGWSRCAVVAPFLSGPRLRVDGPPAVRTMLDRLGGCTDVADELGPRDLRRLAGRIVAPLLIVHGERDDIIPVAHSRTLAGVVDAATYVEVTGGGHNPLDEPGGAALLDRLVGFLTSG